MCNFILSLLDIFFLVSIFKIYTHNFRNNIYVVYKRQHFFSKYLVMYPNAQKTFHLSSHTPLGYLLTSSPGNYTFIVCYN